MNETAATSTMSKLAYYRTALQGGQSVDTSTADRPRFDRHGLDEFNWLASHDPVRLAHLALHELNTDPVLLSQAAEAMARGSQGNLMTTVLLQLTKHSRPFVREAALTGLHPFFGSSVDARDRLREMASSDPSPGVRATAQEALLFL
jgi:hypothetical protein